MDITEILTAGFYLVTVIMSLVVIPAIKNKIGAQNMDAFLKWVDIAVAAAEQIYESVNGEEKKAFVLEYLADRGYEIDEHDMHIAIEAAVNKLHAELYGASKEVISNDNKETPK